MRRLLLATGFLGLLASLVAAGYLWRLDRTITETFEGRRWSVPAIVYASPLELYAGLRLSQRDFVTELARLGYQRTALTHPGSYQDRAGVVDVHLRAAQFVDGPRASQRISVRFTGDGHIASLARTDGRSVPVLRLDPAVIGSFFPSHGEDRVVLTPEQVPELLPAALKAVEDQAFDTHHGFDVRGIARALWVNVKEGAVRQGGSTLTQQLVKSYFLDNQRTLSRKLRELAMSVILELRFDKDDLMNAYINEVYIGQAGARAIHGFGLGAQFYFNQPLGELDTAQIATLVTIIRGPSYYNPQRHPERVLERRNRILRSLHETGLIAEADLALSLHKDLDVVQGLRRGGNYYPAFMDLVRAELAERYAAQDLASRGLRIFTTLNPRQQDQLEAQLTLGLDALPVEDNAALQGAGVMTDIQTGEVLALAGGREAGVDGFNRALHAKRNIGSLIKPVVYLVALEQGQQLTSIVDDAPISLQLPGERVWEPHNFDNETHGAVPLIRALGDSLNLATVNVGLSMGVERIASRLQQLTGQPTHNPYPSLLLGAETRSPYEVVRLYGAIASGGFATAPKSVIAVLDEAGDALSHHPFELQQQIDTPIAEQLGLGLQAVMQWGTGKTSVLANAGVAGKTGTSDDYRDSWFVGYDASHLSVIWIGRDDNAPTGLTGAGGAMRVWQNLMQAKGVEPIPTPPSTIFVDYQTGTQAFGTCPEAQLVALPLGPEVVLTTHPTCSKGLGERLGDRLRRWLGG